MSKRTLEVVDYNPQWPALYQKEAELLLSILNKNISKIHHIGSTSVEHLAAKPIIDILVEVNDINLLDGYSDIMLLHGYKAKGENGISGRRYFQKGGNNRTHHIHAFEVGNPRIVDHLAFRDYLKKHSNIAKKYGELKKQIVKVCNNDSDKYCCSKADFITYHLIEAFREEKT
ncbi:GrpB family protein [Xenorhabdus sp. PB61.4]|uniref:GrpB family protein n=1 Tax=Xenorhabdus sp. PB61.4 TaxID=2788940 RepID=UPI001E4B3AEC|nr:GrpB family protein [Xenorhabdus sp. PB61.4]MCC8368054.1 GrpB family protein [Xenorhabdus sp. PB61.4]